MGENSELNVSVIYDKIEENIESAKTQITALEEYASQVFNNIVGREDAWSSSYQRKFDAHVTNKTKRNIDSLIGNLNLYISYLESTIEYYKVLDKFR